MLTHLAVKNLAIVAQLELDFSNGMHVITGETGAGKSILIDALSIALGERASAEQIRPPHTQAEVCVSFNIQKLPAVLTLLTEQELDSESDCIIRRIINSDGRSRAYINGHSVTAQQLKTLAPLLVHIHGQHQHHALLNSDYQRHLLDVYADHINLLQTVQNNYLDWAKIKQELQLMTNAQQQNDKLTLLNYQIQELENLALQPGEIVELEQKHNQLSRTEELVGTCQEVNTLINGENTSIIDQLHTAIQQLTVLQKFTPDLNSSIDLGKQAIMLLEESSNELQVFLNKLDLDPQTLHTLEQRLSAIHALARKLKVSPEFLLDHYALLVTERDNLAHATQRIEELQAELIKAENIYHSNALILTKNRASAAQKFEKEVMQRLKTLEMPNAKFEIKLEPLKHGCPTPNGDESISFLVTTNPGQAPGLLKKIASGGELSRISLAIQVISAQQMDIPTLILDEVDVGISGKTAVTVGKLIRELASKAQILCITHLPQVASQGHQHFKVEKLQSKNETQTKITQLDPAQRVHELARLMGGLDITPEAIAHAKQLVDSVT